MRLIHSRTCRLQDFSAGEIPPYAILSHTWGEEEVSFQDLSSARCERYRGYAKILQACNVAVRDGLEYIWIDTCCIEKASSAELMESINSMYAWYSDAAVCYVYLEDLEPDSEIEVSLSKCRWFTRGWTLQELLAPKYVELYDKNWNFQGTKLDFVDGISTTTGIQRTVLLGATAISDCSVAMRMSWAARRKTTRVEDMAYCLLGIFDVHMSLIYGEGTAAFRRLQEEIVKRNNDTTIFAWENDLLQDQKLLGAWAPSPASFEDSQATPFAQDFPNFSVTNKGILVSSDMHIRAVFTEPCDDLQGEYFLGFNSYILYLGLDEKHGDSGGIYLRKIGPDLFCRDGTRQLAGFGRPDTIAKKGSYEATNSQCYVLTDIPSRIHGLISESRKHAIHIPLTSEVPLRFKGMVPVPLWDHADRIVLRPPQFHSGPSYPMVLAFSFQYSGWGQKFKLDVFCDYRNDTPLCKLSRPNDDSNKIFRGKHQWDFLLWHEKDADYLRSPTLTNALVFEAREGADRFKLSAFFKRELVHGFFGEHESFCLKFKLEKVQQNLNKIS